MSNIAQYTNRDRIMDIYPHSTVQLKQRVNYCSHRKSVK